MSLRRYDKVSVLGLVIVTLLKKCMNDSNGVQNQNHDS